MASIEFKGIEEFMDALTKEASLESKKKAVHKHGASLNKKVVRNAVFTKGYATGATKRSIQVESQMGGLEAKVFSGTEYSGYLEVGTRKMSAQPFVKPAMEEVVPQFLADLARAEQ